MSCPSSPVMAVRCNPWHGNPPELPQWKGEKPLSLAELRQRGPRKSSGRILTVNGSEGVDVREHPSCGSRCHGGQKHEASNPAVLSPVVPYGAPAKRAFHRPEHATVETLWRYDGGDGVAIGIRSIPKMDGPWTGTTLLPGDIFPVSQELEGTDGILYLRLKDGNGWVFDRKPGEGTLCVRHDPSFVQDKLTIPQADCSDVVSQTPAEDCESEKQHLQLLKPDDVRPDNMAASVVQELVAPPVVHEDRNLAKRPQTSKVLPAAPEHETHAELAHDSVTLPAMPKQTMVAAPSRSCLVSPATISTSAPAHQQPPPLLTSEVGPTTCMPTQHTVGQIIEVLRSDGSYSSGEIKAVHLTGHGIRYDVKVEGGGVKLGVPDILLRSFPGQEDRAAANLATGVSSFVQPAHGEISDTLPGTTVIAAAACPEETVHSAQQPVLNTTARPAVLRPTAEPLPGKPYQCLRVYLGTLEFHGCGAGLGLSGLFESSGYRARVHLGEQKQQGWNNEGAVTEKRPLKYSRVVFNDGKYTHRISCEFDEAFDLPWPTGQHEQIAHVSVDLWLERRTVVERLDSLLDTVGLGNDLPSFDRTWVGFMTVDLPPQGQDTIPQPWPVKNACSDEGPTPKHLSLGVEWLTEAPEIDDIAP